MKKIVQFCFLLAAVFALAGCHAAMLDPKGIIAAAEKHILLEAVGLMCIVVIPVIIMSWIIPWRYREKNTKAKYSPGFTHSTILELIWWSIPCIIIVILAIITWDGAHKLDPYRPLADKRPPILIEAMALNWKWMFIYPQQHIATINYLQIPVDYPVRFYVSSDGPMNSLAMPRLSGQIYAMAGMRTKLNIKATAIGVYRGLSTNFSGAGFAGMHFKIHVTDMADYHRWVSQVQHAPVKLTMAKFKQLSQPSENVAPQVFSSPAKGIFKYSIMKFMMAGMYHKQTGFSKYDEA